MRKRGNVGKQVSGTTCIFRNPQKNVLTFDHLALTIKQILLNSIKYNFILPWNPQEMLNLVPEPTNTFLSSVCEQCDYYLVMIRAVSADQ